MKTGEKVKIRLPNDRGIYREFNGVIVWVHPRGRFALVEYLCGGARFRGGFARQDMQALPSAED